MRSSRLSVKLGSPRLWPGILTAATTLVLTGALAGCVFVEDRTSTQSSTGTSTTEPTTPTTPPDDTGTPTLTSIDPGKALETSPGEGVGVFVEYQTGGHWHVWTACDTNLMHQSCAFDVFATPESGVDLTNPQGENLEGNDVVSIEGNSLHLATQTSTEFDGMTFDATPGAVVRIEALLDGARDPHILYWFGDGVLHQGAPSDPLDIKPTAP